METPKEIILKAFKEGKTIESRDGNGWKDSIPQNQLDKPNLDYGGIDNWRIKPESTMQPLLKLLEGGETVKSDNTQTLHNALEQIQKLEADKAELLEMLEIFIEQNTPTFTSHDYEFPEHVMKAKSIIRLLLIIKLSMINLHY